MEQNCLICEKKNVLDNHFYKEHKIPIKKYYEEFYENKDKLTGELIEFKSFEQYFNTDFINKINLKKYLEKVSKEEGLQYLKFWLNRRKKNKGIEFAPTEFECRSLLFPSIKYIENIYGKNSYQKICEEIKLKLKFNYNEKILHKNVDKIIIDTREQSPYVKLNYPIEIKTLNFADYCSEPNLENIYIERKELVDWCGVMSKSYDRFIKEIQRAKDNNAYIVILIECKYNDLLSIKYLPHTKWIKASSDFLLHRARELYNKFDNFQMITGGNRNECIELFNKIIQIKNVKHLDLQWLIDTKQI